MPLATLFFIAVAAGLTGSLSGMGGGVVLIPVLTFFGLDIKQAIAASNLSSIAVSTAAAPSYIRRHVPNLRVETFLEVFAVIGALVGALITLISERRILFLLCGITFLVFSMTLWLGRKKERQPVAQQEALSRYLGIEGSYYDPAEGKTITYRGRRIGFAALLICGAGVTSGLLGIGGSALTVLVLDAVVGLPPKVSLTTSNLILGIMALAGSNVYLEGGLLNPHLVVPVILGVPLGALIGSKWLVHIPDKVARSFFLVVLIVLGIEMIVHGVQPF